MQILSLMNAETGSKAGEKEMNCGTFGVPDDIDFNLFCFFLGFC
jgi:hypothetical protein